MTRALAAALLLLAAACTSPGDAPGTERPGLYDCEGCERAEARDPSALSWRLRVPPEGEPGERLVVVGRVLHADGTTPAPGVVLYVHQTNADGVYRSVRSQAGGGPGDALLEGWLATGADGRYEIDTIRPGPYPDGTLAAHVHVYVKEPGRRPYYIDDVVFDDDPLVDDAYRRAQERRGGSGIVRLARRADGAWLARRDVVLEP